MRREVLAQSSLLPQIMDETRADFISLKKLTAIANKGLESFLFTDRCLSWILMSKVISENTKEWDSRLNNMFKTYDSFITNFGMTDYVDVTISKNPALEEYNVGDPRLMDLVHGDIIRTGHHIIFFPYPDNSVLPEGKDHLPSFSKHMRRIERILYVFAQINPSIGYMQGFNELICPLFFVYSKGMALFDNDWAKVEALVFFVFQAMLTSTSLHELYETSERSRTIILNVMDFNKLLIRHFPKLSQMLTDLGIHPITYAFKWINLLFAQEQSMPDLIIIWDVIFAHFDELVSFSYYIAICQVKMSEKLLESGNFVKCMNSLQKIMINDVKKLLNMANQLWELDFPPSSDLCLKHVA